MQGEQARAPMVAACVAAALLAVGASAEEAQGLQWIASESVRHDSNLFRLPPGSDRQALVGRSSGAETIYTTTLGVRYDKRYSLQRVHLDLAYVDYRFQNFDFLSFGALNYQADWNWSLTPRFYGNLSLMRRERPNNFSESRSLARLNQRNDRVESNRRLDGLYELDARWRVLGALAQYAQTSTVPLITETATRQTVADAGLRYALPSGSLATLTLRTADGRYTDVLTEDEGPGRNFTQREVELDALWRMTAKTSLGLRLGHRQRAHAGSSERDFEGLFGTARLQWSVTPRVMLTSGWVHTIDGFQTIDANYYRSDRLFVHPTWQILSKIKASVQYAYTQRRYGGSPDATIPATQRRDADKEISLGLEWQPRDYMGISSTVQRTSRSSTVPGLDYRNTSFGVSARLQF